MADANVIACLYPANGCEEAYKVISSEENRMRYIEPSTASESVDEEYDPTHLPGLQLAFDSELKAGRGFIFGRDKRICDIVVPDLATIDHATTTISRRHCCLKFDEQGRLVLEDFSTYGTIVTFDGQGGVEHKNHTWILSGEGSPPLSKIVINIQSVVQFEIIFTRANWLDDPNESLYLENVRRFREKANTGNHANGYH